MTEQEAARLKTLCRNLYALSLDFPERQEYKESYKALNKLYVDNQVNVQPTPINVPE